MMKDREEMTMFERMVVPAPQPTVPTGLLVARRVITVVWLVVCVVQIAIWGTKVVADGHLTFPWWLSSVGSGVATLAVLWVITETVSRKRR
jgi:hypothetical protein